MKGKFIPWTDIVVYGGLCVFAYAATLIALLTPQDWGLGAYISLFAVDVAFTVIACIVILGKLFSRPDSCTEYGIFVWSDYIFSGMAIDCAARYFILTFPKLMKEKIGRDVDHTALESMLRDSRLEWHKGLINIISRFGWRIRDAMGLQSGKSIALVSRDPASGRKLEIYETAILHEWVHMVRELIFKAPKDYGHENLIWDRVVRPMELGFEGWLEYEINYYSYYASNEKPNFKEML